MTKSMMTSNFSTAIVSAKRKYKQTQMRENETTQNYVNKLVSELAIGCYFYRQSLYDLL